MIPGIDEPPRPPDVTTSGVTPYCQCGQRLRILEVAGERVHDWPCDCFDAWTRECAAAGWDPVDAAEYWEDDR